MDRLKVVFLDRDGVLNVDTGYTHRIEDFEFVEGAVEVLRDLQSRYKFIIVSNQGGIWEGRYSEEQMNEFNNHLIEEYLKEGISFKKIYCCPHSKEVSCDCRKPKIGMFEQAMQEFGIDRGTSWTIGDKLSDCIAGKTFGTRTILLKSQYFKEEDRNFNYVDFLVDHMLEVRKII